MSKGIRMGLTEGMSANKEEAKSSRINEGSACQCEIATKFLFKGRPTMKQLGKGRAGDEEVALIRPNALRHLNSVVRRKHIAEEWSRSCSKNLRKQNGCRIDCSASPTAVWDIRSQAKHLDHRAKAQDSDKEDPLPPGQETGLENA